MVNEAGLRSRPIAARLQQAARNPEQRAAPNRRSTLSRAEVSALLESASRGESFSAHVNRQRLEGLRQLVCHRAISSAIICPRTMNPLQTNLGADAIDVSCGLRDRIDEIVPAGPTAHIADNVWTAAVWRRLWR